MWPCGDDYVGMKATLHITDDVVEAIVRGEPVADVYEPLVAFAVLVRLLAAEPAPAPSLVLEDLFAGRIGQEQFQTGAIDAVGVWRSGGGSGRNRMPGIEGVAGLAGKVAGLGLVARLGLGTSIAAAGVAGAGLAGVLPAGANDVVRGAIEVVSSVEFDSNNGGGTTNFGDRVSSDATGESDGEKGVDGQQIAEEAPGAANRPASGPADEPPGQSGETGLTRANQTPAAEHAPDTPGAASNADAERGDPDGDGEAGNASQGGRPETVPSTVTERGDNAGPQG